MNNLQNLARVVSGDALPGTVAAGLAAIGLKNSSHLTQQLPFVGDDVTVGMENEWQAAVAGSRQDVDLARTIEESDYFANLMKRQQRGETPRRAVARIELYLSRNQPGLWENSWVRFPERKLAPVAAKVLQEDLLYDKSNPAMGCRTDRDAFFTTAGGERFVRVPISYLLKLAFIQATSSAEGVDSCLAAMGLRLSGSYTSDNTSPETGSFYLTRGGCRRRMGQAASQETAKRFLLTQLLTRYAEEAFELVRYGQRPVVYSSPLPPQRQDELNECVSDSFYRELLMSPCLSGWDRGEEKKRYMHVCHEVLSRSQLNVLRKLREAGIVNNNLVLLPSTSSLSLANNGTHVTLGSRSLSAALTDPGSGFTRRDEKRAGDLATKFVEHFLPLFPGLYSAAPRRLSFHDFHPELALGFLPHELDYTHLRMLWRRWKKKADLRLLGMRLTPWGPVWLDDLASVIFRMRGDLVPDARLIGYLASLMSTEQNPALNGELGNGDRLKADLERMGVFDRRMSLYLLYRQREFASMGFSGFEGRHYSLFESLEGDLAPACELQALITGLAYQEMARGRLTAEMIPDDPSIESERRQIFFATAIGVPTVFVRQRTRNELLRRLIALAAGVRGSHRYPGYWRVEVQEYRRALIRYLRQEANEIINWLELHDVISDLEARVNHPDERSVAGRIVKRVLVETGARSALAVPSAEFNRATELFYRETLRRDHCREGFAALRTDLALGTFKAACSDPGYRSVLRHVLGEGDPTDFVNAAEAAWSRDEISAGQVLGLIRLLTLVTDHHVRLADNAGRKT